MSAASAVPERSDTTNSAEGMGEPVPYDSAEKLPPNSPARQGSQSAVQEMSQPMASEPKMDSRSNDASIIDNHVDMPPPFDENHEGYQRNAF